MTANEVRIVMSSSAVGAGQRASYEGAVSRTPRTAETDQDRTYRVFQDYFTKRFQLYNRTLQLYVMDAGSGRNQQHAAAAKADEEFKVFGFAGSGNAIEEAVRRGLVSLGSYQSPQEWHESNAPFAYSFFIDGTKMTELVAEVVCKQLRGRPAIFTDDPVVGGEPRVFGIIGFDNGTAKLADDMDTALRQACGIAVAEKVSYNGNQTGAGNIPTAVTRLKAAGVTTIICACDLIVAPAFTSNATQQAYFPEWVSAGTIEMDKNGASKRYDPQQWQHAIGVTALEMARPDEEQDWYRAYKEMDPSNDPHRGISRFLWPNMQSYLGGIQLAGPILKPDSFREGMFSWPRRAPDPPWAVAGGYGPGDWTYADYVALTWWDPDGHDAEDPSTPGAYRHVWGGKRFKLGEIPKEPAPFFSGGITHPREGA